jgi:hypothetical protein
MKPVCQGPLRISRREVLQVGGIGLLGLTLPRLLRAAATPAGRAASADACILIFLNGGPSHLDMWDMKPAAPVEIRGEFRPIASTVPGVQLSELAVYCALTGHDRGEIGGGARPTDYPAIGAVTGLCRPPRTPVVPYVSMPYITQEGAGGPPQPGFFGGWLGRPHDPLFVLRDPNSPSFAMPELGLPADISPTRLAARHGLIRRIGRPGGSRPLEEMDGFQTRAFDLLTSPVTQRAFRIDQEPNRLRDAYGRNIYGQSVLLARRLIEAGTRVACISWAPDANATWDTHGGNFTKLRNQLLPQLDAAVASLLSDLHDRGLLERTLVVVMGEFGRSPRINGAAGRDHWNFCYTLMLAGGGIRGGTVHGASDRIGAHPSSNPVAPADVVATIYHCLGIAPDLELRDRLERPYRLVPWGSPIHDILV